MSNFVLNASQTKFYHLTTKIEWMMLLFDVVIGSCFLRYLRGSHRYFSTTADHATQYLLSWLTLGAAGWSTSRSEATQFDGDSST